MKVDLKYQGHSGVRESANGTALAFAPNLARPRVFFDAQLAAPLRFREAMSALHDVVVGDLKVQKKDRSAYEAWKKQQAEDERALRQAMVDTAKKDALKEMARVAIPDDLEADFTRLHRIYWTARRKWAAELARNDPALFRALVPCDPVVTVAPDIVFFECFSKDESSYGCLAVDRSAFLAAGESGLGTTNVDYSLALYEHFQTLRSYRPTRLLVDPSGFEVKVETTLREEKIDLPSSWLRGFGQLQAALTLPGKRVTLSVDVVYSILSTLRRRREKTGPRSLVFTLTPGKPARIVLEPWGTELVSRGPTYVGDAPAVVKVWGRRRLQALARVLPLADSVEVILLGSGLPSTWIVHMGDMRFVLSLSGWTANDFTSGTNLDALFAGARPEPRLVDQVRAYLERQRTASHEEIRMAVPGASAGALHLLAKRGQVVFDPVANRYRYRPILPFELSESVLGPESPEITEGLALATSVTVESEEPLPDGLRHYAARVGGTKCESVFDLDGNFSRARCNCSFFYETRLRAGPCRHLLALKLSTREASSPSPSGSG